MNQKNLKFKILSQNKKLLCLLMSGTAGIKNEVRKNLGFHGSFL